MRISDILSTFYEEGNEMVCPMSVKGKINKLHVQTRPVSYVCSGPMLPHPLVHHGFVEWSLVDISIAFFSLLLVTQVYQVLLYQFYMCTSDLLNDRCGEYLQVSFLLYTSSCQSAPYVWHRSKSSICHSFEVEFFLHHSFI